MQATHGEFSETDVKIGEDFSAKLNLNASNGDKVGTLPSADEKRSEDQNQQQLEDSVPSKNDLPLRPPVQKVFIEARGPPLPPSSSSRSEADEVDTVAAGPYCTWSKKAIEASPEVCKKSNSTGFSKIWKFRDLGHRCNSDGRDAFVFLNSSTTTSAKREEKVEKRESSSEKRITSEGKTNANGGKAVNTEKGGKKETASRSAHEMHYVRNRALREGDRRRSYLPYRPELVGFFTNVSGGLSRNVHPF
ncbi:hypothetical protein F0562_033318 [Nyssa sinensis]|uniref:Uncharacterized protein n=1 Tax=Nyssa sinensis TaxID=561372 RepID=A0A5J5AS67_9ASTE|nr:hypothetical protein F0562_033318 [Nyssa sinensis]